MYISSNLKKIGSCGLVDYQTSFHHRRALMSSFSMQDLNIFTARQDLFVALSTDPNKTILWKRGNLSRLPKITLDFYIFARKQKFFLNIFWGGFFSVLVRVNKSYFKP